MGRSKPQVHEYAAEAAKEAARKRKSDATRGRPRTVSSPGATAAPDGLTLFEAGEPCPDVSCKYTGGRHFHCSAQRCYFAAPGLASAESHALDFHGSLEIPEGFACFDREVACAFGCACAYSAKQRHFHCLRSGCPEAFLKVNALQGSAKTFLRVNLDI